MFTIYIINKNKAIRKCSGTAAICMQKRMSYALKGKQCLVIPASDNVNMHGYLMG